MLEQVIGMGWNFTKWLNEENKSARKNNIGA
jgi:hypothetical protein